MPTHGRAGAASADELAAQVAAATCGARTSGAGIGLELETFPMAPGPPSRRLRLHEPVGGVPSIARVLRDVEDDAAQEGVALTVEPGGQVEVATACCQQVPDAVSQLDRVTAQLAARFHAHGAVLRTAGIDVWHDLDQVPQQLDRPRYRAMDRYFGSRHPDGRLMMRHTAALQVNLDLGVGSVRDERWQLANLLAPVATATFASSPGRVAGTPVRSRRAVAWSRLDPSRTGFPPGLTAGTGTLEQHVRDLAWNADVLLVRTPGGDAVPGRAGWRFGDWLTYGHPSYGWPTAEDVAEHLTTLFPEARARGFVELRGIDAGPRPARTAAALLLAGVLFDDRARAGALAVLTPHRARLPQLARRAATVGLADPALCAMAVEVWSYARAGASRLAGVEAAHLAAVDAFIDRYTVRGRCPADELADLLVRDPAAARRWATEPLPTASEVS